MNKNNTQTSIEWVLGVMDNLIPSPDLDNIRKLLEHAKEMEKEQVMLAFNDGKVNSVLNKRGSEEYYQDTYGKGIL